jgi:hypothetical protein
MQLNAYEHMLINGRLWYLLVFACFFWALSLSGIPFLVVFSLRLPHKLEALRSDVFNVLMTEACAICAFLVFWHLKPKGINPMKYVVSKVQFIQILLRTENLKDISTGTNSRLCNMNRISKVLKQDAILNVEGVWSNE